MKMIIARGGALLCLTMATLLSLGAQTVSAQSYGASHYRAFSGTAPAGHETWALGESAAGSGYLPRAAQGDPDDPAYKIYRAAYNLILEEQWAKARKKFGELMKDYPDSEYRDDAAYWTAYSYRHDNHKKAKEVYKEFLKTYKNSNYFDDALADLDDLFSNELLVTVPEVDVLAPAKGVGVVSSRGFGHLFEFPDDSTKRSFAMGIPSPAIAPMLKMRNVERLIHRYRLRGGTFRAIDEDDDPETRLKLETLHALVKTGEDRETFQTLKRIALDTKEKQILRITAIEALSEFDNQEVAPLFVEIAKNDTSEEMQLFAIDYIGNAAGDKDRAFDALMALYASLPSSKVEKRRMVFYAIAEIGNDRAIDFLTKVAKSRDDYELRREARYYLGSIGGEKARTVLIDLLKEK
jgi:hypothetical protein